MHKLRGPQIACISRAKKKRMRQLIGRWEITGKSRDVLTESLRVLSKQPGPCALLDTRKCIRARVRYVAFVSHNERMLPQKPALPPEEARLMLDSVKKSGVSRTKAVLDVAGASKWRYPPDPELIRLVIRMEKKRVYGPFSI